MAIEQPTVDQLERLRELSRRLEDSHPGIGRCEGEWGQYAGVIWVCVGGMMWFSLDDDGALTAAVSIRGNWFPATVQRGRVWPYYAPSEGT